MQSDPGINLLLMYYIAVYYINYIIQVNGIVKKLLRNHYPLESVFFLLIFRKN